jgi:hypothetical protein
MIQKKHLILLILCFWNALGFSQNTIPSEKLDSNTWEIDNYLGFDNQKNQYGIKNNVIIKRSTTNFEYKNIGLGKITNIDFQNPLQIIVFYKDFNTVVLLDNQLNEIKRIDFNLNPELIQLEAVGLSAQNQLWIYDGITNKIGLYNITNDYLKWISTPIKSGIKNYFSDYTFFYWTDTTNQLFSSTIYGTVNTLGTVPKHDKMQLLSNSTALYLHENEIYFYEITKERSSEIKLTENFVGNFFFKDGILAIFTQNIITNYKLILP